MHCVIRLGVICAAAVASREVRQMPPLLIAAKVCSLGKSCNSPMLSRWVSECGVVNQPEWNCCARDVGANFDADAAFHWDIN